MLRRLAQSLFVIAAMMVIVFFGVYLIGNPIDILISPDASLQEIEDTKIRFGFDQPIHVQFLQFADSKVKLDVAGNPTMAAKMIGVILGGNWVSNWFIAGLALGILDNGYTPVTLARLGLESAMFVDLAGSSGNKDFYNLVYKNVYGVLPSEATLQVALSQMDSGQLTQADMVLKLLDVPQNLLNIDLVGIQQHGFEYAS